MATNTGHVGYLPRGGAIFCTIPDILYLPELIFGGLVLSLVASTYILPYNPQAYVISVAIFCFLVTFFWLLVFACGSHHNKSSWASADVAYHGFAALLYFSASVLLAFITIFWEAAAGRDTLIYKLDVAAVVFAFLTTLLYVIHTVFSAIRWRSF
ncbi:myelin and lymphocyte -like protein [Labeo rohita]|uniref:Myelin and lymphocyte-like protein n=2 Tax=Labeo rohita TaxID=84645 RepID=A0A498NC54_LABRO|nr:myelin and lymphocyte protein [Labeo rohita]KAI2659108.1 Myelin and lymphocyte protein [Labeo rohita]RXN26537.1 myelin and lymphocyte -like protein [Labeo rohita]RXN34025.1 myelin and lymphocyte -like protein [Labeo rohita]